MKIILYQNITATLSKNGVRSSVRDKFDEMENTLSTMLEIASPIGLPINTDHIFYCLQLSEIFNDLRQFFE